MRITIIGKNGFTPSESNKEYAQRKLAKLERHLDVGVELDVRVVCKVYKNEYHKVEITVPFKKVTLRAEATNQDMYGAIDLAIDKLLRQVRKYNTRTNNRMNRQGIKISFQEELEAPKEAEIVGEVVRTKRLALKPMDLEEAIDQLDLLGHSFYIYRDITTEKVNLVYLRNDGNYALIETE